MTVLPNMMPAGSAAAGTAVLFVSAVAGVVIAVYAYFTPLTGVTGTSGAMLAILVSALIAFMAIVLMRFSSGGARVAWRILIAVFLAGNCFAGALLHEWWLCIAMAVGLAGLLINAVSPARRIGAPSS